MLEWYNGLEGDIYSQGYEADVARWATKALDEYGLKSDFVVILGKDGQPSQSPAAGTRVPPGTTIRVRVYVTG